MSEGSSEFHYVRFQFQLDDGQWESVAFGPTDEADARRFYKRLAKEDSVNTGLVSEGATGAVR